jgi:hypothetical protein
MSVPAGVLYSENPHRILCSRSMYLQTQGKFWRFLPEQWLCIRKNRFFDLLRIVGVSPENRIDNLWGSVPVFDSCPTPHALSKSGLGF